MSAKNGGVQRPPPPFVSQKKEIFLPPHPFAIKKPEFNKLRLPAPLCQKSNLVGIKFHYITDVLKSKTHTKRIYIVVKQENVRKIPDQSQGMLQIYHNQRKSVNICSIRHFLFILSQKGQITHNPLPPMSKNMKFANPYPPLCYLPECYTKYNTQVIPCPTKKNGCCQYIVQLLLICR